MIIVHSILSEFKLEATLHSILGVVLGAKHLFKDFLKKPYPNSQEEKLHTWWEVIIICQLRSDILQDWFAWLICCPIRTEWNLETLICWFSNLALCQNPLWISNKCWLWSCLTWVGSQLCLYPAVWSHEGCLSSPSLSFLNLKYWQFYFQIIRLLGELSKILCGLYLSLWPGT